MKTTVVNNKPYLRFLNTLLFVGIYTLHNAQCAMCKAGAEQSLQKGSTDANWINYGILFLMAIPILLIGGLYFLYRYNQKSSDSNL